MSLRRRCRGFPRDIPIPPQWGETRSRGIGVAGQRLTARPREVLRPERGQRGRAVERRDGEESAVVGNGEGAIESLVDLDLGSGVAAAVGPGENLQAEQAERDGIVIGDDAQVLEAKDGGGVERGGPRAIRRRGIGGEVGKARVIAAQEPAQKDIGALAGADVGEAQFGQEAILKGAKEAFDAPLALGRRRWDPSDPEVAEDPTDLGGCRRALQLLREGEWGP